MYEWIRVCFAVYALIITTSRAQLHGGVRIVDGTSAGSGRVEVFINSQWSTVCDDLWDIRDADVVCRQLGYPRALAAASGNTFPMGNGSILLGGVGCVGNESSLLDCAAQLTNCNHMEDAGVYCFGSIEAPITLGNNGLVMIQYSSEVKPICAVGWDTTAANVACRQLGFSSATSASSLTEQMETQAWLTDIRCNGDETVLSYCRHSGFLRQNCPNNRFAGVSCSTERLVSVPYVQSRLVDGSARNGRLEVYYEGEWGSVCPTDWRYSNALVVCRQLGYFSAEEFDDTSPPSSPTSTLIHFTSVRCTGLEFNIGQCQWSTETSSCSSAVGVRCTQQPENVDQLMEFQLRLVGLDGRIIQRPTNITNTAFTAIGRLDVLYSGHLGTVCSDGFTDASREVACKQLGYIRHSSTSTTPTPGRGQIWMHNVMCGVNDTSLDQCPFAGWGVVPSQCTHSMDLQLKCQGIEEMTPNCGPIPVVENSTPIQNMARVTYTCLDGFTLTGEATLSCLVNGSWSPGPPICNGTNCGPPPNITDGIVQNITSTKVNGIAFYKCISGYQFDTPNDQLICDTTGDWVVTRPVCRDIDECQNETTNNCIVNAELCINRIGSYECCNASELQCQQKAGIYPTSSDDGLSSIEQTSLIIGGVLVFLIAILFAVTIIIVAYIYMFAPRELAVERDTDLRRGNITHPRHMGLSLKEQRKKKGKKKGQNKVRMAMSQLAAYDNVNPMLNDGDDEMDDEPEEIPSGPGLVNPLLMRRMSQASRGRSRRSSVVSATAEDTKPEVSMVMREKSSKPDSRPISRSVTFDKSAGKESDSESSMDPYD